MHRKYNSKEKGVKYEFEVIKLPISATSTEAFEMTEETIRKKSGMEIKKNAAKNLCLDAPTKWIKIDENRFNDFKEKLNKIEEDRKQVPNTQFFYYWHDAEKDVKIKEPAYPDYQSWEELHQLGQKYTEWKIPHVNSPSSLQPVSSFLINVCQR